MKDCKWCGEQIAKEVATGYWKHVFTDMYQCADEEHVAQPKPKFP